MKPALYIFLNKSLNMSAGKAASQATQASVEAYRISCGLRDHQPHTTETFKEPNVVRNWYKGGHHAVYVMEADDATQMHGIERYLNDRGFNTSMHVDEGLTEGTEFVPTALATEIVDKDHAHVQATFSQFKLYRDGPPPPPATPRRKPNPDGSWRVSRMRELTDTVRAMNRKIHRGR